MKKAIVLLAAALLVLGSALPLAGYWLAGALTGVFAPAPAGSAPSSAAASSQAAQPAEPGALPPAEPQEQVLLRDSESGRFY